MAREALRVRLSQLIINEIYKSGEFPVPVHLALGHEAIAVAVSGNMEDGDLLVLSHRNAHYNLARSNSLRRHVDEYRLAPNGIGGGRFGSMNLANADKGIVYTSSILGNNLGVASGLALAQKVKASGRVTYVVTGDGAIEEGIMYEALMFLKSHGLSCIVIVENNRWSLATRIEERRCDIHLDRMAAAFDIKYRLLGGNDVCEYADTLRELKSLAIEGECPVLVEVPVVTFGFWYAEDSRCPEGRFVNYHAGPAKNISLVEWPVLEQTANDPIFVLERVFEKGLLLQASAELARSLEEELK